MNLIERKLQEFDKRFKENIYHGSILDVDPLEVKTFLKQAMEEVKEEVLSNRTCEGNMHWTSGDDMCDCEMQEWEERRKANQE